jgi:hypothetical protein
LQGTGVCGLHHEAQQQQQQQQDWWLNPQHVPDLAMLAIRPGAAEEAVGPMWTPPSIPVRPCDIMEARSSVGSLLQVGQQETQAGPQGGPGVIAAQQQQHWLTAAQKHLQQPVLSCHLVGEPLLEESLTGGPG